MVLFMKNINHNAPVKCSLSVTINSSSVDVWKVLTDIDKWPAWQSEIKKAKLHGLLKPESTFTWKSGGLNISSVLHTVQPYSFFGWTGKSIGVYAIHNWKITELNKQVEVVVEESMEGIIPNLFKKMLNKSLEKSLRKWLELLLHECEVMNGAERN